MRRFLFERFKSKVYVAHSCDAYETFKTEGILNEDNKRVLKEARKKAADLKAEIIVYDLATFKGKLIARLRDVKSPSWEIIE